MATVNRRLVALAILVLVALASWGLFPRYELHPVGTGCSCVSA